MARPSPPRIRAALESLPARPALFLAPLLAAATLGVYYYGIYDECAGRAALRAGVMAAVERSVRGADMVRLAEATPFAWDEVTIIEGYRPQTDPLDCPFGWDWTGDARARLAAAGALTILGFTLSGERVDYIDLSGEEIGFKDIPGPLGPDEAVFRAEPEEAGGRTVLRPVTSAASVQ